MSVYNCVIGFTYPGPACIRQSSDLNRSAVQSTSWSTGWRFLIWGAGPAAQHQANCHHHLQRYSWWLKQLMPSLSYGLRICKSLQFVKVLIKTGNVHNLRSLWIPTHGQGRFWNCAENGLRERVEGKETSLSCLPQFSGWSEAELESCNHSCKLREYPRNKVPGKLLARSFQSNIRVIHPSLQRGTHLIPIRP